jgi:V8-like Glu-specific endopeptidase
MRRHHSRVVFGVFFAAACAVWGCKITSRPLFKSAGYIIGDTNDIKPLDKTNASSVSQKHLNAAVVLATILDGGKRKFCSGTLIGPENGKQNLRVITNYHCFSSEEETDERVLQDISLTDTRCENTKVFFGFVKDQIEQREMSACAPGSMRFDAEADLAIFEITQNPSSKFSPAEVFSGDEVPAGRVVSIVHFPSIDNSSSDSLVFEKTVGFKLPVAQLTVDNCTTLGYFPASEWYLDPTLKMGIKHTCDQKKGSSGSSLWDKETDTILGVNWGGISLNYKDPPRVEQFNVATEAKYLRAFIANDTNAVNTIRQQKSADVIRANQEQSGGSQKTEVKIKKKFCGMIGASGPAGSFALVIMMLLALPVAVVFCRRTY